MAPMTDSFSPDNVSRFYDRLADGYDRMTGFDERFDRERPHFEAIVRKYGICTAVDAGAGTGFHSLLLAGLGVRIIAVDSSARMLSVLSDHASKMHLEVRTVACDLADLSGHVTEKADAVFTLGNTLAHCLSIEALKKVLNEFNRVLRPGGILVAQLLNYRKILAVREKVVARKEADGYRYTRSYDYGEKLIRFTITREDLSGATSPDVTSIDLFPLLDTDLEDALAATGFGDVRLFGGISMDSYVPSGSKDLVVIAHRKA
jgi:SAM-dependent methyltransferase